MDALLSASPAFLLVSGLVVLLLGAEILVRGSTGIAARLSISSLLVGLTVVAFGTSAPELAVSVTSAARGAPDLAAGNAVGSNIFNVLFILGLSALLRPLDVTREGVWRDVPLVILVSVGLWILVLDGSVGPVDAVLLLAGMGAYLAWAVRRGQRDREAATVDLTALPVVSGDAEDEEEQARASGPEPGKSDGLRWLLLVGLVVAGLILLVVGSRCLVDGAVGVARWAGVSDAVIALTVISAGTSLPEVATSVVATLRGERDIAVGNILGSNIFNTLAIVGMAAVAGGLELPVSAQIRTFDLPVMVAAALACLPIFLTGHRVDRWEGGLLLAFYVAYTSLLVAGAAGAIVLSRAVAVWGFLAPLAALTLVVGLLHWKRRPGSSRRGPERPDPS